MERFRCSSAERLIRQSNLIYFSYSCRLQSRSFRKRSCIFARHASECDWRLKLKRLTRQLKQVARNPTRFKSFAARGWNLRDDRGSPAPYSFSTEVAGARGTHARTTSPAGNVILLGFRAYPSATTPPILRLLTSEESRFRATQYIDSPLWHPTSTNPRQAEPLTSVTPRTYQPPRQIRQENSRTHSRQTGRNLPRSA